MQVYFFEYSNSNYAWNGKADNRSQFEVLREQFVDFLQAKLGSSYDATKVIAFYRDSDGKKVYVNVW